MLVHNFIDPNSTFKKKLALLLLFIIIALTLLFVYYYNNDVEAKKPHVDRPAMKTWFHRFNKSDADEVHSIVQTAQGYLVLGDTSPSDRNSFVKTLDFNAKELWSKVFASNINVTKPVGLELASSYLISYKSISTDTRLKPNIITGFNLHIDKITHRILDRSSQVFSSIAPSNEGYVVSGEHNRLFSYAQNGTILWEKTYSRGESFTGINTRYVIAKYEISRGKILKVIAVEKNNFLVLGQVRLEGGKRRSLWIFKVDSSGEVLWEKTFQNNSSYPSDLTFTSEGDYLVLSNDSRHHQIRCQKYNQNGTLLWSKDYSNRRKSLSWHMAQTGDGSTILTGSTNQKDYVKTIWLLKINKDGTLLWQKKHTSAIGDYPSTIIATLDGGVLLGGKTTKQGIRVEKIYKGHVLKQFKLLSEGAWLLKLDENGEGIHSPLNFETTQEWSEL